MVNAPIADSNAGGRPVAFDIEGFQSTIPINIRTFQVESRCPGVGIIGAIRKQNAEGHVIFRDGKLRDLVRAHLFEVERHSRIELAGVTDFASYRAVWQIGHFDFDVHIEGLVGFVTVTK